MFFNGELLSPVNLPPTNTEDGRGGGKIVVVTDGSLVGDGKPNFDGVEEKFGFRFFLCFDVERRANERVVNRNVERVKLFPPSPRFFVANATARK